MSNATAISSASIHELDHLLILCADGAEGYRHAAATVKEPSIHRFLAKQAAEREEIACVLTNALVSLGYKATHHGSVPGAAHRKWIDLLGRLKHDPTDAILEACERGERETLEAFVHALGRSLPDDIHATVQAQLGRVIAASSALRSVIVERGSGRD